MDKCKSTAVRSCWWWPSEIEHFFLWRLLEHIFVLIRETRGRINLCRSVKLNFLFFVLAEVEETESVARIRPPSLSTLSKASLPRPDWSLVFPSARSKIRLCPRKIKPKDASFMFCLKKTKASTAEEEAHGVLSTDLLKYLVYFVQVADKEKNGQTPTIFVFSVLKLRH